MKPAFLNRELTVKSRIVGVSVLLLTLLVLLGTLGACAPVALINALTPSFSYVKTASIAYVPSGNPRHQLDVYQPTDSALFAAPRPVVVFFYGGAWQEGSRGDYLFVAEALTQRGYVVVVPDYRVYPEVKYPEFLRDGAAAVAWAAANADRYGGDRSRIFLMGHSSGAHIAAMLALDATYLDAQKVPHAAIKGLIGLAGPYDFLPLTEPNVIALFASEPKLALTQPIHYATAPAAATLPPSLLLHGTDDKRVFPKNSINLARELRAVGVKVELDLLPGMNHTDIIAKFTRLLRGDGKLVDRVDQFIRDNAG